MTNTSRAHDYGQPRVRVRRLPDRRGWLRAHRVYEIEITAVNPETPNSVTVTERPNTLLEPYLGVADAGSVRMAADRRWDGGTGAWESLFPGDRDAGPPHP